MQTRLTNIGQIEQEKCEDVAIFMLGLAQYQDGLSERNFFSATLRSSENISFKEMKWLVSLYENKDSTNELIQLVRTYIAKNTRKNPSIKHAALIMLNLFDRIGKNPNIDFYQELVNAMWDEKLAVKYANNLYCLCHQDEHYARVKNENRYYLSQFFIPELQCAKWQEAVAKIREIAMVKLRAELEKLNYIDAIDFLENAKTMPIFCEHTSNFTLTGAFGRTNALIEIDELLFKTSQDRQICSLK